MAVPLTAHGRLLGAITFGSNTPGRRYSTDDLALARELARRAAIAIDNATLYRQAEDAVRRRDEFLSIASHELYTPITSLQLVLQGLQRTEASAEAKQRIYEVAERQARKLAYLVDGLLSVSRLQAGRLHLRLEQVDLRQVIHESVGHFEDTLKRSHTALTIDAPRAVIGRWDASRLDQMLTNLLSNAIKFGERRPIRISLHEQGDSALLAVSDQGTGIARERLPNLFQRFERSVSADLVGGLGLGLYIVKGIVTALGGQVHVESRPGKGSTFTVKLPIWGPTNGGGYGH
jgi:signal transduction histidine kinase